MKNLMQSVSTKMKSKKGFTLIEMIVVVAIIAILIALIVPNVMKFIKTTNETAANANAKTIFVAAQTYLTEQYTKGNTNINKGTYNASTIKDFLAGNILAGAEGSYTVDGGAVTEATWTKGDLKGKYPADPTTTP